MKRNISINIRGLIFYIEEDCYEVLKNYLEAVNQYFSKYEDSREIIEDIEGRIAEIFYGKLSNDKEVLVSDDVEEMINTMGSIEDFEATEQDPAYQMTFGESEENDSLEIPTEDDLLNGEIVLVKTMPKIRKTEKDFEERETYIQEPIPDSTSSDSSYYKDTSIEKGYNYRKLYRDTKRHLLGGVAAGLGHYFNIEAIWIRLLFLAFFFGFLFIPEATGVVALLYLAMWAIVPSNDSLEEDPNIRKFYRDSEHGVLGGVCRGIAVYFGINEILVRVVFLGVLLLYGTGVIAYLLLWWLIPKAQTLTDRLQMEGEPITLSSIKERLNKNLNLGEEEKSTFHKVFLFPFQILSLVFDKINTLGKPFVNFIAEAIRIVGGIALVLISFALVLALAASLVLLWGWGLENTIHLDSFSPDLIENSFKFTPFMLTCFYITLFIPSVYIGLFGVMMLRRQIMFNNAYGWSVLGLWLLSAIGTGISAGMIMRDFSHEGNLKTQLTMLPYGGKTFVLSVNEDSKGFINPKVYLGGHKGATVDFTESIEAKGRSEEDALKNAKMLRYNISRADYSFYFDRTAHLREGAKYRNQAIDVNVEIPIGKKFIIDKSIAPILAKYIITSSDQSNYTYKDIVSNNTWTFEGENKIVCLTCAKKTEE